MPAMLDDPTSPTIYRRSGDLPYHMPAMPLPPDIFPRPVTLRDRTTLATLIPYNSPDQVPLSLMSYLCDLLNREIEKGDTYPMTDPLPVEQFGSYWFANFCAVMFLGDITGGVEEIQQMEQEGRANWAKDCLGAFYVKPNYPGRSSHVCNGGFLVTDAARNRGVGRLMGEGYLEWAPKLGYSYSVFNLVYETNVASCRIWDSLGFKRIGRVKGCGNLRSYPDHMIDAIIYGRELGSEDSDTQTEERFDKIKFYLKNGKYPNGADRAEKSRLRSAATHYKLLPATDLEAEKLMLKDKEVISEPLMQYELAKNIHLQHHGGINKTTASIAEKYHWVRIKDTVSQVIKNCNECRDTSKPAPISIRSEKSTSISNGSIPPTPPPPSQQTIVQQQQQMQMEQQQAAMEQLSQITSHPSMTSEPSMMDAIHFNTQTPLQLSSPPDPSATALSLSPTEQQVMLQNFVNSMPVDPSIANSLVEPISMHSAALAQMPMQTTSIPLHSLQDLQVDGYGQLVQSGTGMTLPMHPGSFAAQGLPMGMALDGHVDVNGVQVQAQQMEQQQQQQQFVPQMGDGMTMQVGDFGTDEQMARDLKNAGWQ